VCSGISWLGKIFIFLRQKMILKIWEQKDPRKALTGVALISRKAVTQRFWLILLA